MNPDVMTLRAKQLPTWARCLVCLSAVVWWGLLLCRALMAACWQVGAAVWRRCGWCSCFLAGLLALNAEAAKPEPLTYKVGGRRYVITVPDKQLWSQAEVARSVQWHRAGELTIGGQAIRQARVRGEAGDRTNRLYLVTVIKTGKRLSPDPKYFVRPDPWAGKAVSGSVGEWVSGPLPPKALSRPPTHSLTHSPAAPVSLTLTWPDVAGWYSHPWSNTPVAADGGTRFWTVLSTEDFRTWRVADVVDTNRCVVTSTNQAMFYLVQWRNNGPVWSWP